MRFTLKDYQDAAVREILTRLDEAKDDYRRKDRRVAFALSAITGAGKTVMASAVLEALFDGSEDFELEGDPSATVLWVTDDPNLNEQTRFRIMEASDRLDASRLKIIGERFNQEQLENGCVYFLNRQKLTAKTFISHRDRRTYTLWETIHNTIEDSDRTLYLVLDEAHRGMKSQSRARREADEQDRTTTVLRLINGFDGSPAAPIVWGISATIDRFNQAMRDAKDRVTLPNVIVENAAVQASGLLKDTITLDLPDQSGSFETVLAGEAARACRQISALWREYADRERTAEPVVPLLVVQVPNKPSSREIATLLDTIYDAWPELSDDAIANVFGERVDVAFGRHQAPYVAPQDVQDNPEIQVLLAKDAVSTGWDCPRAETLLSLRPAKDRTHITQLLGRLVRTPLARRVDSDERLNAVTCFLPHFDLDTAKEVADVITGLEPEADAPPLPQGGKVLIDPITMTWNERLPAEVRDCFSNLPSLAAPKTPSKPIKRLLKMAAEIAIDDLLPDPNAKAQGEVYAILDGLSAQHKEAIEEHVENIRLAEIRRIEVSRVKQIAIESTHKTAADDRVVDDAFRVATRAFGSAIANGYVRRIVGGEDRSLSIRDAKAGVAALAKLPAVVEQVDAAADKIVSAWFASLHAKIKGLSEERRSVYDEIKRQAREPQEIELIVPAARIEMTYAIEGGKRIPLPTRDRHLLADEDGSFPVGRLNPWELSVIDREMAREEALAWYRNPSSPSKDALQVAWLDGARWRSMQPDFVFFSTKADGSTAASIVDPHGHHLSDALGKLRGLAAFAERFPDDFVRIEAIGRDDKGDLGQGGNGTLSMLDLTDAEVRKVVENSTSVAEAHRAAGQKYV